MCSICLVSMLPFSTSPVSTAVYSVDSNSQGQTSESTHTNRLALATSASSNQSFWRMFGGGAERKTAPISALHFQQQQQFFSLQPYRLPSPLAKYHDFPSAAVPPGTERPDWLNQLYARWLSPRTLHTNYDDETSKIPSTDVSTSSRIAADGNLHVSTSAADSLIKNVFTSDSINSLRIRARQHSANLGTGFPDLS